MGVIHIAFRDQPGLTGDLRPKVVLFDAGGDLVWNHVSESFVAPDAELMEDDEAYVFADEHAYAKGRYAASFVNVVGDVEQGEVHVLNGQGDLVIGEIRIVDGEEAPLIPPTPAEIGDHLETILPDGGPSNIVRIEPGRTWLLGERALGVVAAEKTISIRKKENNVALAMDFSRLIGVELKNVATIDVTPNDGSLTTGIIGAQNGRKFAISVSPSVKKTYTIDLTVTTKQGETNQGRGILEVTD